MNTYSTCAACGDTMRVLGEFQTHHPQCEKGPEPDVVARHLRDMLTAMRNEDWPAFNHAAQLVEHGDNAPPRLLEAALIYISWGWPVFPLQENSKQPLGRCSQCKRDGCSFEGCKHRLCHGFQGATTDHLLIRRWWAENPRYNIGLATGHLFDAIDVDVPEGVWSWADLRERDNLPDCHGRAVTPSSGQHILVLPEGGGNMTGWHPGIDYRGLGGYILAAPSEVDGWRYRWTVKPSPEIKKRL